MTNVFGREPALIIGAVNALIAVAVGFGLDITPAQVGLINAAVAAVLSVIVRQNVTPTAGDEGGHTDVTLILLTVITFCCALIAWKVVFGT